MLQQTRVESVIPYYRRFLERFPDVQTLASADLDDVLGAWAGLGYYSRARNLRRAAQCVVRDHAGRIPDEVDALRGLPGVGRYTAGAVASIAYGRPAPIVDGNVARVLARWLAIQEDLGEPHVRRRLWSEAEAIASGPRPGDLNQALMELGATLCTRHAPRCDACPVARWCRAREQGVASDVPAPRRRAPPRAIEAVAALVSRGGKLLAVRRPEDGLLGGLWGLPGGPLGEGEPPARALRRALRERLGLRIGSLRSVGGLEHGFTHRSLTLHVYRCEGSGRVRRDGFTAHRWASPRALRRLPQGVLMRKAIDLALGPAT
jgi:A/G-specific adenine glycosylase